MKVEIFSIDEEFEKARKIGAKDKKPRKKRQFSPSWSESSKDDRKRMLREVGVTVHEGLTGKEWEHLPDDVQNRLWTKRHINYLLYAQGRWP